MAQTKTKCTAREEQLSAMGLDMSAEEMRTLRARVAELEAELEAKDQPWEGYGNGTRTGDRRILDSAQLRGAAHYLADNNEVMATGLMVILIEHFATLAFKKNFVALDASIDTFRRWLCREQEAVLMMGIDRLRDDTFHRLEQSINCDSASAIAELAQEISDHSGLQYERRLEARSE